MSNFRVCPHDEIEYPADDDGPGWDTIEARSPIEAAESYAIRDTDGQTDRQYDGEGTDLMVEDLEIGGWAVYRVAWVDHPPAYRERLAEGAQLRAVKMLGYQSPQGDDS